MLEERDLQAIAALIDAKFAEQNKRIDARFAEQDKRIDARFAEQDKKFAEIKEDIAEIKEILNEHSTALDELIGWTEKAAVTIRIPFMEPKLPD